MIPRWLRATGPALLALLLMAMMLSSGAGPGTTAAAERRSALDLPLYDPPSGAIDVPAYDARRIEIRLHDTVSARVRTSMTYQGRTGVASLDGLLARLGVERMEPEFFGIAGQRRGSAELSGFYVVHLPRGTDVATALSAFRSDPSIASASPIGIYPVQLTPNDSLFSLQYWIEQPSGRDSRLSQVWDVSTGDTSVVLAIVDTGVLWDHPDLGGPPPFTGGNIWHNWVEMAGMPGVDDDSNGFIDDIRGWDFVTAVTGPPGEDTQTPDNDPSDYVGHGTFVAGTAAAIPDNVSGTAGAGYNLKVMAVRAGWHDGNSSGGVVDMSFCAQAIVYATDNGASVINCSWLNGDLDGLGAAVDYAIANGVSVVVAAGNLGSESQHLNYLSTRGDCVDVAALDQADARAWFSSYGTWVDVSSGGLGLKSATSVQYQPDYVVNSGTSFAAPIVSAMVGLYQSWRLDQGLGPATPQEILLRLRDTADPVDDLNPTFAGKLGRGRANGMRMLFDPPTSFIVTTGGPVRSTPAFVGWNEPEEAVVFGTEANQIHAVRSTSGQSLPGWPVATAGAVRGDPAIFDLDLDGEDEVLIGADDGWVYALNADGSAVAGWPVAVGGAVGSGPALADVAGGPEYEVIVGTANPHAVHVLDRHGQSMPGWPVSMPEAVVASPAIFDLESGGGDEIVIAGTDSSVYVFRGDASIMTGWPLEIGGAFESSPSIGDVDGDGSPDIVVGCTDGMVHAWSSAGVPLAGWPVSAGAAVRSSPALVKLDGDDFLEVVVGTDGLEVQAWHRDGSPVTGWPYATAGAVRGAPAVADVDDDGGVEIVVGDGSGQVHAIDVDGSGLLHWPRYGGGAVGRGVSLGDPDGDGRMEAVIGSTSGELYVWDLGPGTFDASLTPWFTAGRSFLRQRAVDLPPISAPGPPSPAAGLAMRLSPNPSRGTTVISLTGPQLSGKDVRVSLFDLAGRRLTETILSFDVGGTTRWHLDPRSAGGRPLAAGVYFVEAVSGARVARGKWVLLP
jgi:subtilisin family serine protease